MAPPPINYAERAVGRPKEFDDRVMALYPRLRAFGFSLGATDDNIDDLVQDTIVKALSSWIYYKEIEGSAFESWIFVGMRQTLSSARRKRKTEEDPDDILANLLSTPANQEDHIILKQTLNVMDNVHGGDEVLLYAQGHDYEEIRQLCGLKSVGTVKSRASRARVQLEVIA